MRKSFAAMLAILAAVAGWAAKAQRIENDHYVAVVDPERGGMLTSLTSKATGEQLIDNIRIYTDVGVVADGRYGYVGTGPGSCERFEVRKNDTTIVIEASGKLVGKAAVGRPPVLYRCTTRFDETPQIFVKAAVCPPETKEARGFLAVSWYMPAMARWAVRTIEGLLRHTVMPGEDKAGRSFSHQWPLDPKRPLLLFVTRKGEQVRIERLRARGNPAFSGPVIHGQSVFLCWIDGSPRQLVAGQWAEIEFTIAVGPRSGWRG